jgi:hypothetical protein
MAQTEVNYGPAEKSPAGPIVAHFIAGVRS